MNLYYITVCIGVNNKLLVLVLVLVLVHCLLKWIVIRIMVMISCLVAKATYQP